MDVVREVRKEVRVGIVGSRRRNTLKDRRIVLEILLGYRDRVSVMTGQRIVVVSGGAKGPDSFAQEYAKLLDLGYSHHPVPIDPPIKDKWDFRCRAFARNRDIVEDSDVIWALVHSDRSGGTENTIEHAIDLKKMFYLVDDSGRTYLNGVGWNHVHGQKTDKA